MKSARRFLLLSTVWILGGCGSTATLIRPTSSQVDVSWWHRAADCCTARGSRAAIATGGTLSAQAALEMLDAGGSYVDAAVAAAFVLAVEHFQTAGLGGGGAALVHDAQAGDSFLDFRETAPAAASEKMFLDENGRKRPGELSRDGIFAVATPGFVAGLSELHGKGGKLAWKRVLEPSIRAANEGFVIYPELADRIELARKQLGRSLYTREIFFEGRKTKGLGDRLVLKDLGATLALIAEEGPQGFYQGETAERILATVKQYGGLLSSEDLEGYKPQTRAPIDTAWNGGRLVTAPPPSAAGVLLTQAAKLWSRIPVLPTNEADYAHTMTEVLRRAYSARTDAVGDPSSMTLSAVDLTSDAVVEPLAKTLRADRATPSREIKAGMPSTEGTSAASVVILDADGNAIAITLSHGTPGFGSGVFVPQTGVVLGNAMDDFSLLGDKANAVAPGRRPTSMLLPTFFLQGGKPVLALSAAGGWRGTAAAVQAAVNYLVVFPGDLRRAVFAPRVYHRWLPDKLELDSGLTERAREVLKKRGHRLVSAAADGVVTAVAVHAGEITAVADPREEGGVAAR